MVALESCKTRLPVARVDFEFRWDLEPRASKIRGLGFTATLQQVNGPARPKTPCPEFQEAVTRGRQYAQYGSLLHLGRWASKVPGYSGLGFRDSELD